MTELYSPMLASLPLLLWKTPPGLELILGQEGVPFETVKDPHPLSFRAGRFVLFDGRVGLAGSMRGLAGPGSRHDRRRRAAAGRANRSVRGPGRQQSGDRLVDRRPVDAVRAGGAYRPRPGFAGGLIARLREAVTGAGGVWMRLVPVSVPVSLGFQLPGRPR